MTEFIFYTKEHKDVVEKSDHQTYTKAMEHAKKLSEANDTQIECEIESYFTYATQSS